MSTNHSPTPWFLKDWNKKSPSCVFRPLDIHDVLNKRVLRAGEHTYDLSNAEFIVRAVNNHDALILLLKAVQSSMKHNRPDLMPLKTEIDAALHKAAE